FLKGIAADLQSIGRKSPWHDERPPDVTRVQYRRYQGSVSGGCFIVVHQFMNGRHVRRSRVSLAAGLHQDANELILSPSVKRLARKKCRNAERAAHHLASLEC